MFQLLFYGSILAVPLIALVTGVYLVRLYDTRSNRTQYKFYALTFPSELKLEQVIDWWASVASTFASSSLLPQHAETIVLELRADAHGLTHRLGIPWQHTELLSQLRAHLQGVHVVEHRLETLPVWSHAVEVGVSDRSRSLDVEKIEAQARRVLTAATDDLKPNDHLAIQLIVNPNGRVSSLREPLLNTASLRAVLRGSKSKDGEDSDRRAKLAQNQFKIVLRVVSASDTEPHAKKLVQNIRNAYRALNTSTAYLTPTLTRRAKIIENFNKAITPIIFPAQVSALELSALSTFPIGSPMVAGLTLGKTRYLPPNESIARTGRKLGNSYQNRPVAISAEDACRHMYIIGPSGLGKTTLLTNTLQQDMEQGFGAVVMESKGDLFRAALDAVPPHRVGDVVVMDLTDHDYPVGLNLLHEGDSRVVVDDLIRLFINGASDGLYLPEMMYHGLHTLRHFPDLTVIDLLPFLQPRTPMEKAWREHLIDQLPKGGEFQSYWKAFDQLKPTEQGQKIRPVANRMWQLTNRRDVRNMLGQSESTINLREIMEQNKLLFIYIPDSIGDETVSLLSSLIVSNVWDAVRAVKKDKPTYLYLDEVQRFLNLPIDLADMLSLARSYKLGLVMAHQYTSQLPAPLFAAITNASTQIAFKLDGPDANKMQSLMGKSITADDFMNLGAYEVIGRVATPGGSSQPTYFKTYPQFTPHGKAREVIHSSRQKFARKAEDVDREIMARRTAPSRSEKKRERTFGTRPKETSDE